MNELVEKLGISYPIIQAPMAGVTTPELVAAVSEAGGLGSIGAGYLTGEETKTFIRAVKARTHKPFGINVFVPEEREVSKEEIKKACERLSFCLSDLQLEENDLSVSRPIDNYDEQIEVILEERVPVCSFTFGMPEESVIRQLKDKDIIVIGTATSVQEAKVIEQAGMDAVVVQGSEAGGHRGSFDNESYIGLMSLIPQVADYVSIPVIGAGGIMDGRGVMAALCLGAQAAQLGTAFLTTKESGADVLHKQAILQANEEDAVVTRAFSGKSARGIQNKFIVSLEDDKDVLPYPYQHYLTSDIRSEAKKQGNKEYMSLWSGQSPRLSRDLTAEQLIRQLIKEAQLTKENNFNIY